MLERASAREQCRCSSVLSARLTPCCAAAQREGYATRAAPMRVVFISGPAACGKHTIDSLLSARLGVPLFRDYLVVDLAKTLFEFGVVKASRQMRQAPRSGSLPADRAQRWLRFCRVASFIDDAVSGRWTHR